MIEKDQNSYDGEKLRLDIYKGPTPTLDIKEHVGSTTLTEPFEMTSAFNRSSTNRTNGNNILIDTHK